MTKKERRQFERYETDIELYFYDAYLYKTTVSFQIIGPKGKDASSVRYFGVSRNFSAIGVCFMSDKEVKRGEILHLEVFVGKNPEPIHMEGEVRWVKFNWHPKAYERKYSAGLKLTSVSGKSVARSVHYDEIHDVIWSDVLESVFGSYEVIKQKAKHD